MCVQDSTAKAPSILRSLFVLTKAFDEKSNFPKHVMVKFCHVLSKNLLTNLRFYNLTLLPALCCRKTYNAFVLKTIAYELSFITNENLFSI